MFSIEDWANLATALGFPAAIFVGIRSLYINKKENIRNARVEYEEEFCIYSKLRKDFIYEKTDIDNYDFKDFQELMFELISIFTSIKKVLSLQIKGKIDHFGHLQMLLGDMHYFSMLLKKFDHLKYAGIKHHIEVLIPDILNYLDNETQDFKEVNGLKEEGGLFLKKVKDFNIYDEKFIEKLIETVAHWTNRGMDVNDTSSLAKYFMVGDWQKKHYPAGQMSSTYNLLKNEADELLSNILSRHLESGQMKSFTQRLKF